MKIEDLKIWDGRYAKVKLRDAKAISGKIIIQNRIVIIEISEKHGIAVLPQEIVSIEVIENKEEVE